MNGEGLNELRVILITNTLSISGGSESLVLNIFQTLKKRPGVKVKLVTLKNLNCPTGFEIPDLEEYLFNDPDFYDCNCYVNLSVLKSNKVDIREFIELVNAYKPHIIHSHLFLSEMIAHEVVFPGIKYFTHCHDNMPQLRSLSLKTFTQKSAFTDFYEKQHLVKRYLQCNNKFIAVSADTKNYFERTLPEALKKNISLLPNAIITKNFQTHRRKPDTNVIRIVNVGSFIPVKNQQLLIGITHILLQRGHKVEVTMLGSGQCYDQIKAEVESNNLQQVISMPGTKSNVVDYYANANIYVHTCTHEAFGLVFLEAMASGLPVVCLDAKGNRGLIEEGKTGFMLNHPNPEHFADAIEKVVTDSNTWQAMSARAVEFAQKYDIEEYIDKLVGLYRHA